MDHNLYIIAGPNGAGKTTFARQYLPNYANCTNFINADLIAQGLAPFAPESVALHAGRLMLEQIKLYAEREEDFALETTLAGRGHLGLIRRLKERGYKVQFFFLWLPAVELALTRIGARVSQGGHDIPESVVRRRFGRSIQNFLMHYRPLADKWILFDNSGAVPAVIALEEQREVRIMEADAYVALLGRHGTL